MTIKFEWKLAYISEFMEKGKITVTTTYQVGISTESLIKQFQSTNYG